MLKAHFYLWRSTSREALQPQDSILASGQEAPWDSKLGFRLSIDPPNLCFQKIFLQRISWREPVHKCLGHVGTQMK